MSDRSITILISLYKAGRYIHAKIDNLLQQTILSECNVVFLNCQNLHNERDVYADFLTMPNFSEICYADHIQLYPTWNDGIKATRSKYLTNSNVDDLWHPTYLERCRKYLENHPEAACVSSGIYVTEHPNQSNYKKWQKFGKYPVLPYPESTAGPCPVWRRSLHDKYGYFGNYNVIGDARMWEAWLAGGEQFHVINEYLVLYYASSNSLERRHHHETGVLLRDLDLEYDKAKEENQDQSESRTEENIQADQAETPPHTEAASPTTTDPAANTKV